MATGSIAKPKLARWKGNRVGFAQGPGELHQSQRLCYQPSRYPDDRGAFPVISNRAQNLRRPLKPRHVCIVGGLAMEDSIRRCADTGFTGDISIVNPKRSELGGRKCYASIADRPEAPDATFIAVPREPTLDILRALNARGAGGAICYAAGYA